MAPEAGAAPVVLAVSGASAQPLAQRALQLLLEAGESVELVTSRGAIGVWQAELGLRVPSEPEAQELFWRERTGITSGQLRCHRWNDQAAGIAKTAEGDHGGGIPGTDRARDRGAGGAAPGRGGGSNEQRRLAESRLNR